ncbi:MAG: hypothetical protein AB8B79_15160 [Granulosicoccus sp.]
MANQSNIPLSVTASNFETLKFTQVDEHTIQIKPTIACLLFNLVFLSIGLGLVGVWAVSTFSAFDGSNSLFLLFIGALFAALGLFLYRTSNKQVIINRETGIAYVRSWLPSVPLNTQTMYKHILPSQVEAVQLVSREVQQSSRSSRKNTRRTNSSYTQFQVNCCTDDERSNVLVTLKEEKARTLGSSMSQIFDVPLLILLDAEQIKEHDHTDENKSNSEHNIEVKE